MSKYVTSRAIGTYDRSFYGEAERMRNESERCYAELAEIMFALFFDMSSYNVDESIINNQNNTIVKINNRSLVFYLEAT